MIIGYIADLSLSYSSSNLIGSLVYNEDTEKISITRFNPYEDEDLDIDSSLPIYDADTMYCLSNNKFVILEESAFSNKIIDVYQNIYELDMFELEELINANQVAGRQREISTEEQAEIDKVIEKCIDKIDFMAMMGMLVSEDIQSYDTTAEHISTVFLNNEKILKEEYKFDYSQLCRFYKVFFEHMQNQGFVVEDVFSGDDVCLTYCGIRYSYGKSRGYIDYPIIVFYSDGLTAIPSMRNSLSYTVNKVIRMPDTVAKICPRAFEDVTATDFQMSKNVASIETRAFMNSHIEHIELPDTLTELGDSAFEACGITEIKIPRGITSLPNKLFYNSYNLAKVEYDGKVSALKVGSRVFDGTKAHLMQYKCFDGIGFEKYRIPSK